MKKILETIEQTQKANFRNVIFVRSEDTFWVSFIETLKKKFSKSFVQQEYYQKNQINKLLGDEVDLVILDFRLDIDINLLSICSGSIPGNGCIVIRVNHPCEYSDNFSKRFFLTLKKFKFNFLDLFEQKYQYFNISKNKVYTKNFSNPVISQNECFKAKTEEQLHMVRQVIKVYEGRSKRPLIVTASRGRGKSTGLALAAFYLMSNHKVNIIVTSPHKNNVVAIFNKLTDLLGECFNWKFEFQNSSIQYMSPEDAVKYNIRPCLLFVDEAASIPIEILKELALSFNRVVFSSTVHGYEGTGRGFEIKFKKFMKITFPNCNFFELHEPIRWSTDDLLESWLDELLLVKDISPSQMISTVNKEFLIVDSNYLSNNDKILKQVFTLLVDSHYQTQPSDLKQLLNKGNLVVFLVMEGDTLLGCALVEQEYNFSKEDSLNIFRGSRRKKGNLLQQSLSIYCNQFDLLQNNFGRIMRISVLNNRRQEKIGSGLINQIRKWAIINSIHIVGTSFGIDSELLKFWFSNNYKPVKLGIHKDASSGLYSIVMLDSKIKKYDEFARLFDLFNYSFVSSLSSTYKNEPIDYIYTILVNIKLPFDSFPNENSYIKKYLSGQIHYEFVEFILKQWLIKVIYQKKSSLENCSILILKILQSKDWTICAKKNNLNGRRETEKFLKQKISILLNQKD